MGTNTRCHIWGVRLVRSVLVAGALAWSANMAAQPAYPDLDVGYAPTPPAAVDHLLHMAEVGPADTLVDLGSGDGRIVIAAVRDRGAKRAVGIDLDPWWQTLAEARARAAGVAEHTEFIHGDLFAYDFHDASVVTMYLLPDINLELRPRLLEQMRPGSRIVSHTFDMGEWEPDKVARVQRRDLFMWRIPARVEGRWTLHLSAEGPVIELDVHQRFQILAGVARHAQSGVSEVTGRLAGRTVDLRFNGHTLSGVVGEDGAMYGSEGAGWYAERSEEGAGQEQGRAER